jgi:regulator of sigma E protease
MLISILALIVVLGILVFLHEGGHFLAARAVDAPVAVFSLGFGKRLFGFKHHDTDYRVSLIPLGGYVRVLGLGPDESQVVGGETQGVSLLPRWKRALVLFAGPIANVVGAVVFLALAFMAGVQVPAWQDNPPRIAWVAPESPAAHAGLEPGDLVLAIDGRPIQTWRQLQMVMISSPGRELDVRVKRGDKIETVPLTPKSETSYDLGYAGLAPPVPARVPSVMPGSPAEKAGLQPGDLILAVNGEPVHHFYDVMRMVRPRAGQHLTLTVRRGDKTLTIVATPRDEGGHGMLGIPVPEDLELRRLGPFAAVGEAVTECRRMTRETFAIIGRLFTGQASIKQVSGPVEIANFSGQAARAGLIPFIYLLGVISLQLAIFNLLPIPLLDGGHLTIVGIETVIRRDLSEKLKERILNIGFWLIVLLFIVVLYNDIAKIVGPILGKVLPG